MHNLFKFMQQTVFFIDKGAAAGVASYENLQEMLLKSTVAAENYQIRNEVFKKIREILSMCSMTPAMGPLMKIVKILAFEIQPHTEKYEQRCFQFYDGLTQVIENLTSADLEHMREPFLKMIIDLSNFIFKREIKEKNTSDIDNLLIGKMKLLKSLL